MPTYNLRELVKKERTPMRYQIQVMCIQEDSKDRSHYGYANMDIQVNAGEGHQRVAECFFSGLPLAVARARAEVLEKINRKEDEYEKDEHESNVVPEPEE